MNGQTGNDPKPIIPAFSRYYGLTSDLAYLLVRVTAGAFVLVHGWTKATVMTHTGLTGYFGKLGLEPAGFWAYYIPFNETVVALLVVIGLWTRPAALLLVIEFIVLIIAVHIPRGYGMAVNGVEFPLFWLFILIAVLLRGGGPYSIDRKIGKEICLRRAHAIDCACPPRLLAHWGRSDRSQLPSGPWGIIIAAWAEQLLPGH